MTVFVSGKKGEAGFSSALSMEPDAAKNKISRLSTKGRLMANAELFC